MNKKIEIESNLLDIKAYVEGALNYFDNENDEDIDKKEVIAYLGTVPQTINETKELLEQIEYEYEIKIFELESEKWYE